MIDDNYHLALWKREVMNQTVSEMLYQMDSNEEGAAAWVESLKIEVTGDEWDEYFGKDDTEF